MNINRNKGFTLIEVMIVLAILVIIFAMVGPLFVTGINYFRDSNNRVITQGNARRIMTDLSREVRDADPDDVVLNSSSEIEVEDFRYSYSTTTKEITKTNMATAESIVIAREVTLFNVTRDVNTIVFEVRSSWDDSTIKTTVTIRTRPEPTPE